MYKMGVLTSLKNNLMKQHVPKIQKIQLPSWMRIPSLELKMQKYMVWILSHKTTSKKSMQVTSKLVHHVRLKWQGSEEWQKQRPVGGFPWKPACWEALGTFMLWTVLDQQDLSSQRSLHASVWPRAFGRLLFSVLQKPMGLIRKYFKGARHATAEQLGTFLNKQEKS